MRLASAPLMARFPAPGPTMFIARLIWISPVVSVIVLPASAGANWIVFPSATFAAVMASRRLRLLAGPVGSSAVLTTYVLPACAVVAAQLSAAARASADTTVEWRCPRETTRCNADARLLSFIVYLRRAACLPHSDSVTG